MENKDVNNNTRSTEEIKKLYNNGIRQCDIANLFGVSKQYISYVIKNTNSERKYENEYKRKPTNRCGRNPEDLSRYENRDVSELTDMQKRILKYRLDGKTNKEIAEIEGKTARAISASVDIIKKKLDGTYKKYIQDLQKKRKKMFFTVERGIKKAYNKYMVLISYRNPGERTTKTKHVSMADNLEIARKIRNQAELARDEGRFEEWFENFIKNGKTLS